MSDAEQKPLVRQAMLALGERVETQVLEGHRELFLMLFSSVCDCKYSKRIQSRLMEGVNQAQPIGLGDQNPDLLLGEETPEMSLLAMLFDSVTAESDVVPIADEGVEKAHDQFTEAYQAFLEVFSGQPDILRSVEELCLEHFDIGISFYDTPSSDDPAPEDNL